MAVGAGLAKSVPLVATVRSMLAGIVLWYFRFWARMALSLHTPTVIGIAGAVGKSTTRNALFVMLKGYKPTRMVEGNSETGIPLGILGLTPSTYSLSEWIMLICRAPFGVRSLRYTDYLIVEMGIDGPFPPKNMEYLLTIVRPQVALLLNESPAHVGNYEIALPGGGLGLTETERLDRIMKLITRDDGKIITASGCRVGITNADDPYISSQIIVPNEQTPIPIMTFGTAPANTVQYAGYSADLHETVFRYRLKDDTQHHELSLRFTGIALPRETQSLFAAALLAAHEIGIPLEHAARSLEQGFTLPPGRGSLLSGIRNTLIIDSTYNASRASVLSYLDYLKHLRQQTGQPTAFLFGDMKELGQAAAGEHQLVTERMIGIVDYLYCVGDLTRQFVLPVAEKHRSAFKDIRWFSTSREAGMALEELLPERALLLAKGSQLLEESLKFLLATPTDAAKLCRQDSFWKQAKFTKGNWVE